MAELSVSSELIGRFACSSAAVILSDEQEPGIVLSIPDTEHKGESMILVIDSHTTT